MKAQYLTSISTAFALAMTCSAAFAQSSNVPIDIKLSQQAPKPESVQSPKPKPLPQVQQAPQGEISQEELQKFANAVKKLQPIQQEADTQITQAIQQQNLSQKRFGEIYQARRNPQAKPTTAITPEETKKFDQVGAKIQDIEQATQSKMERAVRDEGLDIQRFNQIFAAIRQNPALLQKVQQMIQS